SGTGNALGERTRVYDVPGEVRVLHSVGGRTVHHRGQVSAGSTPGGRSTRHELHERLYRDVSVRIAIRPCATRRGDIDRREIYRAVGLRPSVWDRRGCSR